jgi:branched-chain amino acid transport system permease protein
VQLRTGFTRFNGQSSSEGRNPSFQHFWPEFRMLMFALVILLILLYMPDGLLPWIRDKIETECPRCKIRNVATRKTCRACTAQLN